MKNGSLMQVKSIAEWSILQYFWPALSYNWSWKPSFSLLFEWPLKTGFTVHLTLTLSLIFSTEGATLCYLYVGQLYTTNMYVDQLYTTKLYVG